MLDILSSLRSVDGTDIDTSPKCSWQDLPGTVKFDNDGKEVELSTNYKLLLRKLRTGASTVSEALRDLAKTADKAGHTDAARDTRVARGWLKRLSERDWNSTTWDADYSRLSGFWSCMHDAQVALDGALHGSRSIRQAVLMRVLESYLSDIARLEPEAEKIERSRTTLTQKVIRRLSGTLAALTSSQGARDDEFWQEESVGASSR